MNLIEYGIPGLFLLCIIDGIGVITLGGPDIGVLLLSYKMPSVFPLIAFVSALGSAAGSIFFFRSSQKCIDLAKDKFHISPKIFQIVREALTQRELLSIFIIALIPPPITKKPFIVISACTDMKIKTFFVGMFCGRFIMFLLFGLLGAQYGEKAWIWIETYGANLFFTLVLYILYLWGLSIYIRRKKTNFSPLLPTFEI